eukprot:scaffold73121_cov30-Tisochrysis_lutea.AAC.2
MGHAVRPLCAQSSDGRVRTRLISTRGDARTLDLDTQMHIAQGPQAEGELCTNPALRAIRLADPRSGQPASVSGAASICCTYTSNQMTPSRASAAPMRELPCSTM